LERGKEPGLVKDHLATKKPSDAITIRIMRGGSMRNFTIVLGTNPNMDIEYSIMKKLEDSTATILNKWLKP